MYMYTVKQFYLLYAFKQQEEYQFIHGDFQMTEKKPDTFLCQSAISNTRSPLLFIL